MKFNIKVIVPVLFTVLGTSSLRAQGIPPLAQIVSNVVRATQPSQPYAADVNQQITTTNPAQVAGQSTLPGSPPKQGAIQSFRVSYDAKHGYAVQHPKLAAPSGQTAGGTNATPQSASSPTINIAVNFVQLLQDLENWPQAKVMTEQLDGRLCYKVTATSAQGLGSILWIDAENSYISKAVGLLKDKTFYVATCEYRNVDGLWMLSNVTINYPIDGTQVVQNFGEYTH